MLEDTDHMEANCVLYVKVGRLHQLEYSTICDLTITKLGIAMLTVPHYTMFSLCFRYVSGDFLRQTSPDIMSIEQCPVSVLQTSDFGYYSPLFIPISTLTTSDRFAPHYGMFGNACNLQLYAVGLIVNRMCNLAAFHSILTSC